MKKGSRKRKHNVILTLKDIINSWDDIIAQLEQSNSKISHFLEDAIPYSYDGKQVLIELKGGHRFQMVTLEKDAGLIESAINDILNQKIKIKFNLEGDYEESGAEAKNSKGERMKNNKLLVKPTAKSDITLELLDTKALLRVVSDRLQTVDEEFTEYREENKDKIDFYDRVKESKSTIDFSKAAKLLGYDDFGRGKLFAFCREQGYLRYRPGTPAHNEPYQNYMNLFEVEMQLYTANGKEHVGTKTVFTQKGFNYIRKKLDECNNYE